jgi:hypothetical protein
MSNPPPVDEAWQETSQPGGFPKHWIVLGLLVVAHAAFGAYVVPSSRLGELTVGVVITQPMILATWAAFARQRFYRRFLWSLLFCIYLSFADALGVAGSYGLRRPGESILEIQSLFIVLVAILLVFRRCFRWQLTHPDLKDTPSVYLAHHFGISHLLTLTAFIALVCGLVRTFSVILDTGIPFSSFPTFIGSFCLLLFAAFLSWVVTWIILASRRVAIELILLIVLAAISLDLAIGFAVGSILRLVPATVSEYLPKIGRCWDLQLGAIPSAIVSTLVLRFCGFRMIREPKMQA